jgi:hypothetical protein
MALVAKPQYQEGHNSASNVARLDEAALAAFGCDVSFISDDSTPAEERVTRAAEAARSHDLKHLLWEIFERCRADYGANSPIVHPAAVATRVRQACGALGIAPSAEQHAALLGFAGDVNKVLFQHETLGWLANDANFKLHLYGRGWERHPALACHARGPVPDERTRQAIFRASKINLSASPYGAVVPHLLEGVAAGGFFFMRFCPADVIEKFFPPLIDFCARERIHSNAGLNENATPGIRELLAFASRTLGVDVLCDWPDFVPHLLSLRAEPRSRSAAVLWPEHYAQVCFSSRDELLTLAAKFLYDQPQRRALAEAMRRQLANPAPPRVSVQVTRIVSIRRRSDIAA